MRILPAGTSALLIEMGALDQVDGLYRALLGDPPAGVVEYVPAARTLLVRYDSGCTTAERLAADLAGRDVSGGSAPDGPMVEIPVRYDGADLAGVAELTGMSEREVVDRHTAPEYRVAFCGFAPGFGYLSGGDRRLHVPRRDSPRVRVPAGSVAVAGEFTAVYPSESPGGWQLLGHTDAVMWDTKRNPPALLVPGGRVRFVEARR